MSKVKPKDDIRDSNSEVGTDEQSELSGVKVKRNCSNPHDLFSFVQVAQSISK